VIGRIVCGFFDDDLAAVGRNAAVFGDGFGDDFGGGVFADVDDFGAGVLVLAFSSHCYPQHICFAIVSFEYGAWIEHGGARAEISVDSFHVGSLLYQGSFGIEIVGVGGSVFY
jgi:hypothetical protein